MMPTLRLSIRMRALSCVRGGSGIHQGYTPFEGVALTGQVKTPYLRGGLIYDNGKVVGPPRSEYPHRPKMRG